MSNEHKEYADRLRVFADFYESRPDLPKAWQLPNIVCCRRKEEFLAVAKAFPHIEKKYDDSYAWLILEHAGETISYFVGRQQVCERKVVGTELVPVQTIPEHFREKVEWECHPLLKEGKDNGSD